MFESLLKKIEKPAEYPALWAAIHHATYEEVGVELNNLVKSMGAPSDPRMTIASLKRLQAVFNAVQQYREDRHRSAVVRWLRTGAVNLAVDALLETIQADLARAPQRSRPASRMAFTDPDNQGSPRVLH